MRTLHLALAGLLCLALAWSACAQTKVDGRMVTLGGQPLDSVLSGKVGAVSAGAATNTISWLGAVPSRAGSRRDYTHMTGSSTPGFGEVLSLVSQSTAGLSVDYDVTFAATMEAKPTEGGRAAAASVYGSNIVTSIDTGAIVSFAVGQEVNINNFSTFNFGDNPAAKATGARAAAYSAAQTLYLGPGSGRVATMLGIGGPDTGQGANRGIHLQGGDYIHLFGVQDSSSSPTSLQIDGAGHNIGVNTSGSTAMVYSLIMGQGQNISSTFTPSGGSDTQLVSVAKVDETGKVVVGFGAQGVSLGAALITQPSTPASSSAACTPGQLQFDTAYIYTCIATNTWRRTASASF